MPMFYGYKHWTLEITPRCFYVGKGLKRRSSQTHKGSRNHKWHAVVKRFGLRVEVCVGPVVHEDVRTWEIAQIAQENTFSISHAHDDSDDIGCNFTRGGEGTVGWHHHESANRKRSETLRGRKLTDAHKKAMKIANARPETKLRRSISGRAAQLRRFADPLEREKQSARVKQALSKYDGRKGRAQRCSACLSLGHNRKTCNVTQRGHDEAA